MKSGSKFVLRQSTVQQNKVKRVAKANKMSMNQYICNIIADALVKPSLEVKFDDLVARLEDSGAIESGQV